MDAAKPDKKDIEKEAVEEKMRSYRLVLTHQNHEGLESVINTIKGRFPEAIEKSRDNFKVKGPVRMPTKTLSITTRKSPCGNGTNTFDRYELRIHKRVFRFNCSDKTFQTLLSGLVTEPGMIIEANEEDD